MRRYATVDNNLITSIVYLEEEQVANEALKHSLLVDIEDITPQPQIGWILDGNTLKAKSIESLAEVQDLIQQTSQRKFGENLVPIATDLVGARNLKLARANTPVDVALLAQQMLSAKILLEGGALKTVRNLCLLMRTTHINHQDIFDFIISEINIFLNTNNYQ
jgi:hypothetical protein